LVSTSCRTSGRRRAAGDDENVGVELARVRLLAELHPTPDRLLDEVPRHTSGIRNAVLAADHRADHVVDPKPGHEGRIHLLHRHS
jgi:hypothetical protein